MKIRQGFVSNSSSSSFLVGFKKRPKTVEELRTIMFGEMKGEVTYFDHSLPISEAATRVFDDLKEQKKALSPAKMLKEIRSGYFDGYPDLMNRFDKTSEIQDEFCKIYNEGKAPTETISGLFEEAAKTHPLYEEYLKQYRIAYKKQTTIEMKEVDEAAKAYFERIRHRFDGCKVYVFSYADDGGEAVLEHGGIFENLPHICISHH